MLVVDVIAVAALVIALIIGISRGLLATLGTIVGLIVGPSRRCGLFHSPAPTFRPVPGAAC